MRAEDILFNSKKQTATGNDKIDEVSSIAQKYIAAAANMTAAPKKSDGKITTASDVKKPEAPKYKPEDNPIIRALDAGDYGAGKDTRVDKVLKGASQSTESSLINTLGTLSGGTGELTMGQSAQAAVKGQKQQTLETEKKQRQNAAVQQRLYNKADELSAKSEKNIADAKEGLGNIGQTLVDVGVAGTQMLGDAVLNLASPGAGLIGMGLRSFGSGAQEQRQNGGTETDMLLGGLKSAAIEVLTEMLGGFYGKSKISGAVNDAIKSIGKSDVVPALLTLVKEGAEEAVEEILSDIFNPLADRVLDLDNKRGSGEKIGVFSEENIKTMIHDGIVGGILGFVGGGGQIIENALGSDANTQTAQNAAEQPTAEGQQTTPTAEANAVTEAQTQLNSALQNDTPQMPTNPIIDAINNAQKSKQNAANEAVWADGTAKKAFSGKSQNPADYPFETVSIDTDGNVLHVFHSTEADAIRTANNANGILGDGTHQVVDIANGESVADAIERAKAARQGVYNSAVEYQGGENEVAQKRAELAELEAQQAASMQANPADYGVTEAEITQYVDDGLGAANIGFNDTMQTRTSQYRTNTMERNYDPDSLNDFGFEEESGNFDYKVKPEAQTLQAAQTMFDYYMDMGGIEAVKEALENDNLAGAERGDLAEIAQRYLEQKEREGLSDNSMSTEEWHKLVEDRLEIAKAERARMTDVAQSLQAKAKWTRADTGSETYIDAAKALEETDLSDDEKRIRLKKLSDWCDRIDGIGPKSENANGDLKAIIKDIADERGVTKLVFAHKKTAPITNRIIDWSLDRLNFAQLQQLALNSAKASVYDIADPADVGQKIKAAQIIFMLSRPRTPARNVAGNTTFSGVDTLSMDGAALWDMLMSRFTDTRSMASSRWLPNKAKRQAQTAAAVRSIAEVLLDVDMGAESRYGNSGRTFKANGSKSINASDNFVNRIAKRGANTFERVFSVLDRNNRLLMVTTDEIAKGGTRTPTAEAVQKLVDEGKIKTDNENYAQEYADTLARERTFQEHGTLAEVISNIRDALNTTVGIGDSGRTFGEKGKTVHSFGLGDLVAPFTKVAGNLASTAYDYSVVNAVKGLNETLHVIKDAKNGSVDPAKQAQAAKDFARGMNGTMLTALCYIIAKAGLLKRANDEDDADVAALNAAEGMTGTQLNIDAVGRLFSYGDSSWQDGDTLLDISSLEPLNTLLAVGTVAATWDKDDRTMDKVYKTSDVFLGSVEELPVLQFVNNVMQGTRYSGSESQAVGEQLGNTVISSVTPNFLAGIASGTDMYVRDTYSSDNSVVNLIDKAKSRTLGARETLPIKQTPFGEDKKYQGTAVGLFLNQVVNPVGVNKYTQGKLSQEMQNVREATGVVNFYPEKTAPNTITENKVKYDLSYDEKQKYMKAAGEYYQRVGSSIIQSKEYKSMDDETKAEALNKLRSESAAVAKSVIMSGRGVGAKEKGLSASEIVDKVAYSAATNGGGDSIKDRVTALNNGYSEQKIYDMWVNDDGEAVEQRDKFDAMNKSLSNEDKVSLKTYLPIYQYKESLRTPDDVDDQYYCKKQFRSYLQDEVNSGQLSSAQANAIFLSFYKDWKHSK